MSTAVCLVTQNRNDRDRCKLKSKGSEVNQTKRVRFHAAIRVVAKVCTYQSVLSGCQLGF